MKQELQDKLFKDFPKLFAQKDADMKVTCKTNFLNIFFNPR